MICEDEQKGLLPFLIPKIRFSERVKGLDLSFKAACQR